MKNFLLLLARHPSVEKVLKFFLFLFLVGVVCVAGTVFLVRFETSTLIYEDVDSLPDSETALILGASVLNDGSLSPVLRERVDSAIRLYDAGKISKILVTGDNGTLSHNEVTPIKNYLVAEGIPEGEIFLDYAGFDTYSSLYRARDIFKVHSLIVVTQGFHLPRALFIGKYLGMNVVGFKADANSYYIKNYIREWFADVKAIFDLLGSRQPKYLGEEVPIGENL